MKNKWLVQSNGFKSSYLFEIAETLNRFKIDYNDFGVVDGSITNLEQILEYDCNFISRGGTRFLNILEKMKCDDKDLSHLDGKLPEEIIKQSSYYINKLCDSVDYKLLQFDQYNYSRFDLPLLNSDAKYYDYEDIKNFEFTRETFIKPSRDLKSFNGGVIYAGETLQNYLARTGYYYHSIIDEKVVVSPLKEISEEYRFFMYKDKILGCSRYMINGKVEPNSYVPDLLKETAIEYSKLYQPMDLFVMDLAVTDKGIKIVEYNCWNASGFYHCNIRDIIFQINEIKQIK